MKFNTNNPSTRTTNKAGGAAFKMTPELELIHGTLTTFLDDKYYESGQARITRLEGLIDSVNPEFVARLAVVARKEFHLRSVSHLLLGRLAMIHSGDDLVKRAVVAFTERPDDLTEFAAYVISKNGKLTKQAKRGIRNALLKFDSYQLGKYRAEGKAVSLVDLFNLTHPKTEFATEEQREAWGKLLKGELKSEGTWETEISNTDNKTESWEKLVLSGKIGYMALLRNLNNLLKSDVSEEVLQKAAETLRDPERVKRSKQLPFRFYTAYQNVKGNRLLSDAISEALDISVDNVPTFEGKTLIAVDSSGSMKYNGAITNAAVLASALLKSNVGADVILYDTSVKEFVGSGRTPVIDLTASILQNVTGGGTQTSLVFDYAMKKGLKYDRIIILSDNESWAERYWGGSVQDSYLKYMATGADPYVFAVDIQGYGTKDISHPKVFHTAGWSDRILDFIGKVEQGESLANYVKEYRI